MLKEAKYYKNEDTKVRCLLCPNRCLLEKDEIGSCQIRINNNGKLYTKIYGATSAVALDPIEKKPLYHFYPGKEILSFGTVGCNFHCIYCQNYHISQTPDYPTKYISPEKGVELALKSHSFAIAYTYSEPLIWYEYIYDTAKLAKEKGIKNVLVTNGYIEEKPLLDLLPLIDAANIDVKSFNKSFYARYCKGKLEPVLRNVEIFYKNRVHIELTMLIIPTLNDNENEIKGFVRWVKGIDKNIPVHFSRYFPNFQLDIYSTPAETLQKAYNIAKEELNYVYIGNIRIRDTENTYCPNCKALLIEREGYFITIKELTKNRCKKCNAEIAIINE